VATYEKAVAVFNAALAKLHTPGTSWPQYAAAIEECDAAWRVLAAVAANAVEAEA